MSGIRLSKNDRNCKDFFMFLETFQHIKSQQYLSSTRVGFRHMSNQYKKIIQNTKTYLIFIRYICTYNKLMLLYKIPLTHWGQVTHICFSKLGHHWFSLCILTCLTPSHYLNGLAQDCSNSSALAMELLQSCTKPPFWTNAGTVLIGLISVKFG